MMKNLKISSHRLTQVSILVIATLIFFSCKKIDDIDPNGDSNDLETQTLSGLMSENTTLKNRNKLIDYVIDGNLNIDGNAMLTIEPGVKIVFTSVNDGISVGQNAGIKMIGTLEDPIVFSGPVNNQNSGSWDAISIYSNRSDNQMSFVHLINGGSSEYYGVINLEYESKLKMDNCLIKGSLGYGMYLSNSGKLTSFTKNIIEDCSKSPVYLSEIKQGIVFDTSSEMGSNDKPYIKITSAEINENITIQETTIPYYLEECDINIFKSLTVKEGVVLYFDPQRDVYIDGTSGRLIGIGTIDKPVVFTRIPGETYFWEGINVHSNIGNSLTNCIVEYGGAEDDEGLIYVGYSGGITFENVKIQHSNNYGIVLYSESKISSTNVIFDDCSRGNVYNMSDESVLDLIP